MAISSSNKLVTLENLQRFKGNLDTYIAGDNITFTTDETDIHKITISASSSAPISNIPVAEASDITALK